MLIPSEHMIGGLTVVIGEQTASINGELHRLKIVNTVARCPTRLIVLMNTISFLDIFISLVTTYARKVSIHRGKFHASIFLTLQVCITIILKNIVSLSFRQLAVWYSELNYIKAAVSMMCLVYLAINIIWPIKYIGINGLMNHHKF